MHTPIASAEQDVLAVLYASHTPNEPTADGTGLVVVHARDPDARVPSTFCALLSFPGLSQRLAPAEAQQLLQTLSSYVTERYFQIAEGSLTALEDVLEALHLYVRFINRDATRHAIQGCAVCAEIRGRMLNMAYSEGTCNIVTKYGSADAFPLLNVQPTRLVGSSEPLYVGKYQAELHGSGTFFLGTSDWCLRGIATQQQAEAKRDLVQAVAFALSETGAHHTQPFAERNPDQAMPGLLLGFPPPVPAPKPAQSTFVPSQASTAPEPVPADISATEAPEATDPEIPVTEPTASVQEESKAELDMHSAVENLDSHAEFPDKALVRIWAGRLGQRLTAWFSEVFPDPQTEPPATPAETVRSQTATIPDAPAAAETRQVDFRTGTAQAIPADRVQPVRIPGPTPEPLLDTQKFRQVLVPSPERASSSRTWISMMLLVLFIVMPLATWIAYSINDEPVVRNQEAAAVQAGQHIARARNQMALEQSVPAQQALQEARNIIQAVRAAGGLTPELKTLQIELEALWNEAYNVVTLVGLTEPLLRFGRDANPAKVIVNTQDLFILDTRHNEVVKYRLDLLAADSPGHQQPILRQGHLVEGVEVGRIMDMAFQPTKTAHSDKPSLYLIDDRRNIFQYNDTDLISVVDLDQKATWQTPALIDFYSNRMYVADAGLGQIWRYNLNSASPQQEGWLVEPADLSQAIRMHVDDQIWVLMNNNSVVLFGNDGDLLNPTNIQMPFGVQTAIDFDSRFVDLEVGPNQSNYLLLPDPGQQSILVMDKASGDFLYQLATPEGFRAGAFSELSDVYVHREKIYILTAEALFVHDFHP